MKIPQAIKNHYMVRPDYLKWIEGGTSIFAYIDLTNVLHWQNTLGWKFKLEDFIEQLFTFPNIKEVKVYYGVNERDAIRSKNFHNRIKKTGAILKTKAMKFIIKDIDESLFFQRKTMNRFEDSIKIKIQELIDELKKENVVIEEPKCNFDVEITMDMIDDIDKATAILLFSGDSDFVKPLERLKIKGKKIGIVGVRGKVAGELHKVKDKYINFGLFYTGKRVYLEEKSLKSENPAEKGGTA